MRYDQMFLCWLRDIFMAMIEFPLRMSLYARAPAHWDFWLAHARLLYVSESFQ